MIDGNKKTQLSIKHSKAILHVVPMLLFLFIPLFIFSILEYSNKCITYLL